LFRRWSLIVLAIVTVIAMHSTWDYLEARSLKRTIDRIRASGGPVAASELESQVQVDPVEKDAAPYYMGAAALAGARWPSTGGGRSWNEIVLGGGQRRLFEALTAELQAGKVSEELLARIRQRLTAGEDALRLLDRAAELEFRRFGPGTDYGYRTSQLFELKSLCSLRTRYLAVTGDGLGAAASLIAGLRLGTVLSRWPFEVQAGTYLNVRGSLADFQMVLDHTRPPAAALERLAGILAEIDADGALTRSFIADRARLIDAFMSSSLGTGYVDFGGSGLLGAGGITSGLGLHAVSRPLSARRLRQRLSTYQLLIDASQKPWPQRSRAVRAVPIPTHPRLHPYPYAGFFNHPSQLTVDVVVTDTARIRVARVAVAVERYRRAHGETSPQRAEDLVPAYLDVLPIDPYTGEAIAYRRIETGYMVSSAGKDIGVEARNR
jgi:hypothetical protein